MKRFLMLCVVAFTCLSLMAGVAEAKRFGGGSSFGKSRPAPAKQMQREQPTKPQPAPAQNGANRWLGPLAGLAIGAGLATLFSHGSLGDFANSLSMLLMVVAGAMLLLFILNKFRKPQPAATRFASANGAPQMFQADNAPAAYVNASNAQAYDAIPADFPVDAFLRQAKASFIRLQAANDAKDLNDVRGYTTPEVFAEISLQMQERGDAPQTTEVLRLEAQLIAVVEEGEYRIASVRYTGQLRENAGATEYIDEIWHLQQALHPDNAVWLLAGIQQAN